MGVCVFICKQRKTKNPTKIKNSKNNENNNTISSNKDDIKNTIIETTDPFLPEEEDEINEEQNTVYCGIKPPKNRERGLKFEGGGIFSHSK